MNEWIQKLKETHNLSREEWISLIANRSDVLADELFAEAREVRQQSYGNTIYIRGLIEFTNHCKNDCFYCGIRKSNGNAERYRLSKEEILSCCKTGYALGFRTFVLQGGEDGYFTDKRLCDIVSSIKGLYPDCALTLSVGEKSRESYQSLFDAGADRYLLRHETFDFTHYGKLHPASLSAKHRQQCLWNLKEIGYQVGTGFMVGSPYQTAENLADDMLFIKQLNPQMVGIGPFIPHHDTPFREQSSRKFRIDAFYARSAPTDASQSITSSHNRTWNNQSKRTRTWNISWCQCHHAELVTC